MHAHEFWGFVKVSPDNSVDFGESDRGLSSLRNVVCTSALPITRSPLACMLKLQLCCVQPLAGLATIRTRLRKFNQNQNLILPDSATDPSMHCGVCSSVGPC